MLSIIIPTFNEQAIIAETLETLQPLRQAGHEIIIVDGNSTDNTRTIVGPLTDSLLSSSCRNRAQQMNTGVYFAHNSVLLFLHADTVLPKNVDKLIFQGMAKYKSQWGRFDVNLSGKSWLFRVIEKCMNWRSCFTSIATGDQAIFVKHKTFDLIKGFPNIYLMEDIAISKRLKKITRPVCIKTPIITSSRRWEQKGIVRTVLLMWFLRLAYVAGVNSKKLKLLYDK
ncbi:MAG: TIGR04283 family arsenosugar biosynthesis glycosyltransferase [Thiomargarita sp.]|nr:TIGR04283 family arsenosugar biosynthesis glycosyltransferase [Thiomargarita sp.]